MPNVFKTLINVSVWFLFLKGIVAVALTLYIIIKAFVDGDPLPMFPAAAGCAVGSFAFTMTCVAVWIRQKVD